MMNRSLSINRALRASWSGLASQLSIQMGEQSYCARKYLLLWHLLSSEADYTLKYHIESSSFSNFNGADQKRSFTFAGDALKYTGPTSTAGPLMVWNRVK